MAQSVHDLLEARGAGVVGPPDADARRFGSRIGAGRRDGAPVNA
jgi:hypothetical protein